MQVINKQKALLKSSASVAQLPLTKQTIANDPHLSSFQHTMISNKIKTIVQPQTHVRVSSKASLGKEEAKQPSSHTSSVQNKRIDHVSKQEIVKKVLN